MEQKPTTNRLPDREAIPFETALLIIFALLTGGMAFWAMLNLITDQGASLWFKAGLIGIAAGLVSFAVNKFAIERGAPQAAKGYILAPMISIGSILLVGIGLFASTYAGLTINQVRELTLQEYGRDLGWYVSAINNQALESRRIVPVVESGIADLKAKRQCEFDQGCLNGKGISGSGPTTRALTVIIDRAETIQQQMESAKTERSQKLGKLNQLLSDYQSTLGQTDSSLKTRREALVGIASEITQTAGNLREALPLALLQAYAGELETGIVIADRPVATQNVNAVLRKHAQSLQSVLGDLEGETIAPPAFPALAGVSSTFTYMGHFFPIAVLTAAVELVLPLALWVYTLMDCRWEIFQQDARSASAVLRVTNSGKASEHNRPRRKRGKAKPASPTQKMNGSSHPNQSDNQGE